MIENLDFQQVEDLLNELQAYIVYKNPLTVYYCHECRHLIKVDNLRFELMWINEQQPICMTCNSVDVKTITPTQ